MKIDKKPPPEKNTAQKEKPEKRDAIATTQHKLPSPLIATMEDLHIFSAAVFKSKIYAQIQNPETAMVRIQAGRELGLQPMMALNKIHVLPRGQIVIATAVLGAVAMEQGIRWQILQKNPQGCKLRIYKLDGSIPEHTESFMWEDAVRANLSKKDNYQMYPEEMCFNRCLSKGLRVFDPRIGAGFYTKEEMEDVDSFGSATQVQAEEEVIESEIVEAEEVSEEEEYQEEMGEAMGKEEETGPDPNIPDESPGETKQKAEDIIQIKKHFEVLQLDIKDTKLFLSEVQSKQIFVRKNQFGHLSLHCGDATAISYLNDNRQKICKRYYETRMKTMKPGEKIGCFVVPTPEAPDA